MQNGFIQRFNRNYREAVLDMYQSLAEVREQTEKWLKEYNEERPHESLGDMTPREYLLTQNPKSLVISRPTREAYKAPRRYLLFGWVRAVPGTVLAALMRIDQNIHTAPAPTRAGDRNPRQ